MFENWWQGITFIVALVTAIAVVVGAWLSLLSYRYLKWSSLPIVKFERDSRVPKPGEPREVHFRLENTPGRPAWAVTNMRLTNTKMAALSYFGWADGFHGARDLKYDPPVIKERFWLHVDTPMPCTLRFTVCLISAPRISTTIDKRHDLRRDASF